ncbi:uncharacterized protein [Triticum aestivum]|uniref:uncharacterized protein n=1 Tax=Triticum aestivum TaxID=4565 RepID=UPI001D026186|nr:uncharacterized protein LOC123139454 [Triticum aestivum]
MVSAVLPPPVRADICIVPRSTGMADLERRLQLAVVAYVGGARPPVSCVDAAIAISEQLEIPLHRFSVPKFHPEDFLVVFASHDLRNKALEVPFIEHPRFKLFTKPWLRQAQAQSKLMRVQVDLMIEGVPSHAWSRETASELLGSSCLIESLAPETLLEYPTLIHIGRLCDHSPPEFWRRSPSSDGGGSQSGLPESFNGFFMGEWTVLPWSRGVRDDRGTSRRSPGHAGGGG